MPRLSGPIHAFGLLVLLSLGLGGCASVQRAVVGSIVEVEIARTSAASSSAAPNAPSFNGVVAPVEGRRWKLRSEQSRFDIVSGDAFGTYASRVTKYEGFLTIARDASKHDTQRPVGHLALVLDMTSFRSETPGVTACLQYDFLDVDTFPEARLEANVRWARPGSDDSVIEGTLDLHGHKRRISFQGRLHIDAGGPRLASTFDLDRRPFDIRRRDNWDFLARNDFRVTLDLRGTPETVTVEQLD